MIHFIEGALDSKTPTYAVISCNGVGYHILIPLSSYDKLPGLGTTVRLRTHLAVREDDMTLFGFMTEAEHQLFQRLITVSGIGPKIALGALSGMSAGDLKAALMAGDVKRLSSISGIGKKTAERMIIELRDKFSNDDLLAELRPATVEGDAMQDAVLALIALGYKEADASRMLGKIKGRESKSVEELIRIALGGA